MSESTEASFAAAKAAVQAVIKACGGADVVASEFGINRVSVYEWIAKGRIPGDRAPVIAQRARERGHMVQLSEICSPVPWDVAYEHMKATKAEPGESEAAEQGV